MRIEINPSKKYQIISGFGVSGAWWAQEVGGYDNIQPGTNIPKYEYIAKLLFDKNEGIGITQYRYNLGAGSKESGRGDFGNPDRRAECFEKSEGIYDWDKDKNAVRMLKSAVEYGADEITFFVNSPIERLTDNHKAHLDKKKFPKIIPKCNLSKSNIPGFAEYCLDVCEHFISEGVPVRYISPVNEPVWVWTGGQEGCHYRPTGVYKVMKQFAAELEKRPELKNLKLSGAENGDIRWLNKVYSAVMCCSKDIRKHIDSVDVHSYFLFGPFEKYHIVKDILLNRVDFLKRYNFFMKTFFPDVPVKVSEWCHMQGGRNCGIDSAIEQAKVMSEDLTYLNAVSWQEWVALSYVDYCDGLIYYDHDENFELTKRYYGFGNFSKFIRPGSVRIDCRSDDKDCIVTAFEDEKNIYVVIVNKSESDKTINTGSGKPADLFVTDKDHNLEKTVISSAESFSITGKSINTLIIVK